MPFGEVPLLAQVVLTAAFIVIITMCLWTTSLFVRGQRAIAGAPAPQGDEDWTWVFLVAALNEEITIGDSVERLLALELAQRRVIVIDDGSDDGTPEILGELVAPRSPRAAAQPA